MLPLSLMAQNQSIQEWGLLDTGATVNVLPYRMGLALGLKKETQKTPVQLGGILAQVPAYGVLQKATINEFPPVQLVLKRTEAENIPLILGRMNFFQVFDVCFYGAQFDE